MCRIGSSNYSANFISPIIENIFSKKMERVFLLVYLCLTVLCVDYTHAVYIKDPSLCSRSKCHAPSGQLQKFKYLEGIIYRYAYSVDVSTNLGENNGNGSRKESTIQIDSVVSLSFASPCEGYLKITESSVSSNRSAYEPETPDRAGAEFKKNVEQHPIRFAFQDGVIHEVCPHPDEPVWSLNFKKGILSHFQNSMRRFDVDHSSPELDVNGICDTKYELYEARKTSLIVKKKKNIPTCTDRYKFLSVIQSTTYKSPYSSEADWFRAPLLKSSSECEITIDHNIYERVECAESYMLKPLSNGKKTGARTDTRTSLRLIEELSDDYVDSYDSEGDNYPLSKRVNLLYNHADTPKPTHGELRTSRDCVKNMCRMQGAGEELQQEFSEIFTKFIHSARLLNYPSLTQLMYRANSICRTGRKHIIDALPYVGSNAALTVQKDLIIRGQVSHDKVKEWVTGFALIPRPDRDTIWALAPLLERQKETNNSQFDLAYSSVIHAFCSNTDEDCLKVEPVARFLRHIESEIEKGCARKSHTPLEIRKTIEALKSFGNMGVETKRLRDKLMDCMEGGGGYLTMEVKVAAIEAHRRLPSCEETRDRYFLNVYRNLTLETEVRIASYLQVMRCPDYNVIKLIRHTLKVEEVNQVGSFVWSHLTNLLKSSSPSRIEIQSLLTDRDLGMKFNGDIRKFSRNYETSFFSDEYNLGANYQTNLIFSPSSYIPRTATVNATLDVFGESINAFEIALRFEGMEFYAEKFFGPDGPLSNEKITNHFRTFLRSMRSAKTDNQDYNGQIKRLPNVIENNFDNPRITFALKVFGNDLQYSVLNGDKQIRNAIATLDPWAKIKQILSGKEMKFEKATMFLDSSYVVPTTAGLPLKLGATGSAACNFKMSGMMDSERLTTNGEIEVMGNMMPSVSVDVTGTMTVDAFYKSAGIRLRSNLYSSGAVRGHLNVKGMHLISLNLGLPNQRIEIFSAMTDVLLLSTNGANTEEIPVGMIVTSRDNKEVKLPGSDIPVVSDRTCSWPALDKLVGLKLCTDYQFSNVTKNPNASYFVLNGPSLFKVSLIKADPSAKSYLLEYKWNRTETESVIKATFDTPGSKINRELSAQISFDGSSRNVSVLLQSAGNSLVAKGTYKKTDSELSLDLVLDINGTKHFDASVGYTRTEGRHGYTYKPKLYLAINSERVVELSGAVRNVEKDNVSQSDINLLFETKRGWSKVTGYVITKQTHIEANAKLEYELEGLKSSAAAVKKKETLQIEVSLSNLSQRTLTHKSATLKMQSSAYPQLNIVMAAWYRQALGHLEIHTEINSSPHLLDDRHKLTAEIVLTNSRTYLQHEGSKIAASVAIKKPIQNLDVKVGLNHVSSGIVTKTDGLIRYAPGKEIVLVLNMKMPRGALLDVEAHANLTIPTFTPLVIDIDVKEQPRNEYDLNLAGTWFSGHNITARGTYVDSSTLSVLDQSVKLLLKSPSFPTDVIVNCKVYDDASDLRIDLQMEQIDLDKYALIIKHSTLTLTQFSSYFECRYKSNVYTLLANVDKEREARVEMHLDRWRDVHLIVRGIDEIAKKEVGLEIKWDANRDPNLKFATAFQLVRQRNSNSRNVSATGMVTYPGRLATGRCLFALLGQNNYLLDTVFKWSPNSAVQFTVNADYRMEPYHKIFKMESQLVTPFEFWKKTSFNTRFLQNNNTFTASGSVYWQDTQHFLIDLWSDLKDDDQKLEWRGNCGLGSTVHHVKWITSNVTHVQTYGRKVDSRVLVNYYPDKVFDLKSSWELTKDKDEAFNVTGRLNMISPLASYERGDVICSFKFTEDWKIQGGVYVDLDKRKYTGRLIGDIARLRESMVQFNLTTPIDRFSTVRGKLGFSESEKHVVAKVDGPHGAVGFEGICQLFAHGSDFNVKLELATPIDLLQRTLVVAKLNKKEADFRIGYNNITAGFQGVWYFLNLTDFHHRYIIYTPLEWFEECGIVLKLVVDSVPGRAKVKLDTEFSVKLTDTKIGIAATAGPKPPPFVIPKSPSELDAPPDNSTLEYEDDYEDDDILDEKLYWQGQFQIDPAIFETVVGELDIDEEESTYKILGSLKIPPGIIRMDDRFFMEDIFTMKNDLKIDTPFDFASEITSTYLFNLNLDDHVYLVGTDLRLKNHSDWIEVGYNVNYTSRSVDDLSTEIFTFNVKTPLRFIAYVKGKIILEKDDGAYKSKVDLEGPNCRVNIDGSLESDDGYLDSMMLVKISSPIFVVPRTKLIMKKDMASKENRVELGMEIYEPVSKVFNLQGIWHVEGMNLLNATAILTSPVEMLENVRASLYHSNTLTKDDAMKLDVEFVHRFVTLYKLTGNYRNNVVSMRLNSPLKNFEAVEFLGKVVKVGDGVFEFSGDLRSEGSSEFHKVDGQVTANEGVITSVEAAIIPQGKSQPGKEMLVNFYREDYGFKIQTKDTPRDAYVSFSYMNLYSWNLETKIFAADNRFVDYQLMAFIRNQRNGNLSAHLFGKTPWKSLEQIALDGNLMFTDLGGSVATHHRFNRDSSDFRLEYYLKYMEDMFGKIIFGYDIDNVKKHIDTQIFYKNPKKIFRNINTGFDVNVDHEIWRFGSNVTLGFVDENNIDAILSLTLPPPDKDVHTILISYHGQKELNDYKYAVGYNTIFSKSNYASDGSLKMQTQDINGHLRLTWGLTARETVNNLFNVTFDNKEIAFDYSLITPNYLQEETLVVRLNYDGGSPDQMVINANVYSPSTKKIGTANLVYASLANVNGSVNASTPFKALPYAGCNFIVLTTIKQNKRYVQVTWPENTAVLNSQYAYQSERLDSSLEGSFQVEIPLNTRHIGYLTYGYKKRPLITTGHSELTYNGEEIMRGNYKSKSQSRAGFERDNIEITIENPFKPLGINYMNQYEYSGGIEGTNYPTVETKHINVYRLDNRSEFDVTGESRIRTTHSGQDVDLKAVHSNRTVKLRTDYNILPGEFDHNWRLSLAEDAWASYHVNIVNKTTDEVDNQFLIINLAYPRRNFTLDGSYKISSTDISSQANLEWDKESGKPRSIGAGFDWSKFNTDDLEKWQEAVLSFKHPSFEKDVTFTAKLFNGDPKSLVKVGLVVDYSTEPEKLLVLSGRIRDESVWPLDRKYSYEIIGRHPNTRLDLRVQGSVHKHGLVYGKLSNFATYKRSFLPVEAGQLYASVDLSLYEIELRRENKEVIKYLKTRYYPAYPEYVVNGSMIYTPDTNATGHFYLNLDEKLTWLMVNYTPDAVESLRMLGKIPDARNAVFDIWRTYDQDLVLSDVAFYLRLNHSRLVTSTLRWRPDLKEDITNAIKSSFNTAYQSIGEDAEYWKQYIRSETAAAISDVWEDAQTELYEFLEDCNNLREVQVDFDDLKLYLNDSYNANEFYIRDIVGFGTYLIDELSLRSHIQSLPNIVNEIWDIMGESGLAIRNSLIWAIETVKAGYNKLSEIVAAILKGDSMTALTEIFEKLVEKYDKFVKDLHVSFIKYMENLWNNIFLAVSQQWSRFLKYVEPMFIKVLHYLETVVWSASNEVLHFLYDRRNDIITSPYFDRFTNFTQDVDRIYKDIQAHDIVTNVRKYSAIIIDFVKERYFTMVPFGKELKNVVDEIIGELQELTKLPSVRFTIDKVQQLYAKIKYLYDYFEVGDQLNTAIKLIHLKFTDISQTALQAENRYREAKTKFIFSPEKGLLCLEQKLPMSWHAFNQTPEFQEIAEYRAFTDMRTYFVSSNMTFWTLYHQYKPYTEPSSWLPPFRAQAMIAGGQHYMTFDGRYYEFSGECTYLLAQDFVRHQFAVLVKYDADKVETTHQIIVLIGGEAIQLDVSKNSVKLLNSDLGLQLPAHLGNEDIFVYQEESIVIVESQRRLFKLECNMKYDLCILELSGWYYGKTAGLFGTMSNEQSDDYLNSHGRIETDVGPFARTWSLDNAQQCRSAQNKAFEKPAKTREFQICKDLFANKSSEFNSCFNNVDPNPYRTMCLNTRSEKEACTVAVSYIQVCLFHDTYLRIPDRCTRCSLVNGTEVKEGEFRKLEGDDVPKSTDVVFIVEAKSCNRDVKNNASLEQLISQLNKEFTESKLSGVRWSLVTFGGNGVFDEPRSLVINGETFATNYRHFTSYFDHIPIGNGNQDIFSAIRYATKLGYRAGVSKTFVLLPCSQCDPRNQTLNYSVLNQVLIEQGVTLHILMDGDFQMEKERLGKITYGLDAGKAYTKKDSRSLDGDVDLRRQVKLSKSILGYCTPLALETNGTIFSGRKLRFEKPVAVKKFSNVFSKRVALSATPSVCQHCECMADNNGVTKMECVPCVYPTPVIIDYEGFNEDESLAALQPFDFDYNQTTELDEY
ncbi:uncharacterized protein LOC105683963 [Athalia rosae]|uniref:uncharacterized protein LOC105683963 n=1 Tax=Athalia rosae TaxID=37344 RepID=UPI002033CD75|nr:uncharacterized protein LOC105683963 [Athalia rosae]